MNWLPVVGVKRLDRNAVTQQKLRHLNVAVRCGNVQLKQNSQQVSTYVILNEVRHFHRTTLITSAQEVMLSLCLFVSRITQKLIFTKFGGKVEHGPQKKRLHFGGNALGLG